jgi:phosphoribosylformimino-5-aminoimidazole carboxamide ribotide isomerase
LICVAGKVVRLKEGDPDRQTTFSDDPIATAQGWIDQGATWIHMVNLDGAFNDANDNLNILEQAAALGVKRAVRRWSATASTTSQHALDLGASRVVVILGTVAVQTAGDRHVQAVERFGADAVCVALDARDGKITTHGWQQTSPNSHHWITARLIGAAAESVHALYTDVLARRPA